MRKDKTMDSQTDYLQKLGYESRDVSLSTIARWIIYLFIFIGVTSVATLGLYLFFISLAKTPAPGAVAMPRRIPPDPNPIVQGYPVRDINEFRKDEDEKLNGYQWKDRDKQIFSIPVDRAMELVLHRGLPARPLPGGIIPPPPAPNGGRGEEGGRMLFIPPKIIGPGPNTEKSAAPTAQEKQ